MSIILAFPGDVFPINKKLFNQLYLIPEVSGNHRLAKVQARSLPTPMI